MHDFTEHVQAYLHALENTRKRGGSEDSIRQAFLNFLRSAFPALCATDPIELEKHIPALRVRGGFADALYGDLIFEFKRNLNKQTRAEGIEELSRYLRNQKHPERFIGLLVDGVSVEAYALRDETLEKIDEMRLTVEGAADARLWLDCYLFHEKNLVPTTADVALRFGDRSPTFWRSTRILEGMWESLSDQPSIATKYIEWDSLLSIVYGSAVGDRGLFLRHTYLALFARVLAFVAVARRAPGGEDLPGILSGLAFDSLGFENFVGDDFFTWMTDTQARQEVQSLLRALGTRLAAGYNLAEIHEDLLKELYQELVDPETRHDLGEFYTPDWLAELTLRKAGFPDAAQNGQDVSLCDPACGSGTFLFTAVRLLREAGQSGGKLVNACARNLAGMDVHPLAVMVAKTNLLLALGDDLRRSGARFTVPVFMADALNVANHAESTTGSEVEIPVDVERIESRIKKDRAKHVRSAFGIPTELANRPDLLHAALNVLMEFARPDISHATAQTGLKSRLENLGISPAQMHLWRANLDLMRWLLSPPPTNSVWRFILENACQPQLLASRRFAFVVGNPPWLSYRYIQRPDYQQRVRNLAGEYHLFGPGKTHLSTQMEIATLFFAFCADWYLKGGGTLAFVMPRSVLTGAKQHEQFRRRYVDVDSCRTLIDCERVDPLFNVPACAIVWEKPPKEPDDGPPAPRRDPVPTIELSGTLPLRNAPLAVALSRLDLSERTRVETRPCDPSPYLQKVTQGASIVPRCLWFVQSPEIAWIVDQQSPHLETNAAVMRQAKKPWRGIRIKGSVESEFLYATLLSDDMVPFGWRRFSVAVLPLAKHPDGTQFMLEAEPAAARGWIGLYKWLREAEKVWLKHRKTQVPLLDYLNWRGKLTRQQPKGVARVLFNTSGTHLCACVPDTPSEIPVRRDHVLPVRGFVADTKTYWFETKKVMEAHYLCAFLNAPIVDQAIKPYQTKGLFGSRTGKGQRDIHRRPFEVLPIPRYSPRDPQHRELARLSRKCHRVISRSLLGEDEKLRDMPIGRLRSRLRKDALASELERIDNLVRNILSASPDSPRA